MKKVLFFFVILLITISVKAQQQFTNFASKNTITSLADKGSQMWIGTSGGLYVRSKSTGAIILTYTIDNGLPSSYVNDVVVDPFDNVWVATENGLAKFDGSNWTVYDQTNGLPHNKIRGITVDQSGNIWVFSFWNTLSKLESNGTWTNYGTSEGFPTEQPNCISTGPNGNIWIGTYGGGAYDFNIGNQTFTQHTGEFGTYDRVYDIIQDANANLWFASYSGLTKFDGSNWTLYTIADGLAANNSKTLSSDASNNIWVGSYGSGVTKFDPSGANTAIYNESNGLGHNYTDAITVDSDGKVWVGTRYGLNRYDVSGDSWNEYIVNNSLSNNTIYDIKVAANGDVWVGTEYGLSKLSGTSWINWFYSDGLIQDRVKCVAIDNNGDIWTGANYGISHLDVSANTFTTYGTSEGITDVEDILVDSDGSVWCASTSGLIHFDGTTTTEYTTADGLVANSCHAVIIDLSGNIWVGTSGGVSMWNGTSFTNYTTSDGLSQNYIHDLSIADNGDIWAFPQAQASIFDGTSWSLTPFSLSQEMAQSSDGNYWIAHQWGIKKWDETNIATYTTDDGLADDYIFDVAIAPDGVKWFGTHAGLIKAVCESPVSGFTSNIACLPGVTTLINTSTQVDVTTTYQWDINNDGSVEYTTADASHSFTTEGTVPVKLTVTNDDCSDVIIQDVVTYNTPVVSLNPFNDFNICSGSSATIEALGASTSTPIVTEDFDYVDLAASGWTVQGDGQTNWSIASTTNAGGDSPELKLNWSSQFVGESSCVSPVIDASSYSSLSLDFSHYISHYSNSFTVEVKTSSDGSTWNSVWSNSVSDDIATTSETISITNSDVGSSTFQIAFVFVGDSYDLNDWEIDNVVLSGATVGGSINPNYSLNWSTGATSNSINVSSADTYGLTVTNGTCIYSPSDVTVSVLEPMVPSICMVTVDTTSGLNKNLIVWEKPNTGAINYYNIYREVTTDNYQVIGSVLYANVSEFNDPSSDPDVHADKYKISVVDTCGNESPLSNYHQTMNLSQAQGAQADEIVLIWNKYIDESGSYTPASYKVYRGIDPYNMTLESTLSGGLSSYNYNVENVVDGEHFMVVVDMPTCNPSQNKATGGPYYQSTSNLEDEGVINTGLSIVNQIEFNIYPNPVKDFAIIKSSSLIRTVNIYNIAGELIRQYKDINASEFIVNREQIAAGTYFVRVNGTNHKKIVFE